MSALVPASFSLLVAGRDPEPYVSGDEWLTRLPRLVEESMEQWDLILDGAPMHGRAALVLPVRRRDGGAAVLKVTWPHAEARDEHLALQRWSGNGAVRLLAANPGRWTMLLERLDSARDLYDVPIDDACAVIGDLLEQLDCPALPQLSRLSVAACRSSASMPSSTRSGRRRGRSSERCRWVFGRSRTWTPTDSRRRSPSSRRCSRTDLDHGSAHARGLR